MKKSFWFWLCFVVAVIFAVYFATRIIMTTMGHGASAFVKSVSISTDSGRRDLSAVVSAAGIAPGTRTYDVELAQIADRIARVPSVKTAAVRRLPNGNLAIRVRLHHAVALWTDGTSYFPVSGDGTIINTPTDLRPDNSVVFRGALPTDIVDIAKAGHNIASQLDYFEWIENRRWNIQTTDGITILLPENDPTAAISALMLMDKNHKILSRKIQTLDMRDSARTLVK